MNAALIVTTYNHPRYLGLCLESLRAQTRADFDVWVADDGSGGETRAKLESVRRHWGARLRHIWHPDQGYRKAMINNEVLRTMRKEGARYEALIFVDHDTIEHPRFVEDHLAIHEKNPNALFMGRRVDLDGAVSDRITEANVREFARGLSPRLLASGFWGGSQNVLRAWRVTSPALQRLLGRDRVPDLLGSNFSVATELMYRVNGYDESLQAYWGEDGDLFVRLRNAGARIIGRKGYAVQYHLFHPRLMPEPAHERRYAEALQNPDYVRCANGIDG